MNNIFQAQQDIFAYLTANLNWDVYTGGVEEAEQLKATDGVLRPHVILRFSAPQPYLGDLAFGGPRYDGVYNNVDAMCVAANDTDARMLANEVNDILLGYQPNSNCSQLRYDFGGGTFAVISENSRPQFTISWVSFRFNTNMVVEG